MVRLKACKCLFYCVICEISIPYGAIKSLNVGKHNRLNTNISIPYGAIKSLNVGKHNRLNTNISIPYGAIKS